MNVVRASRVLLLAACVSFVVRLSAQNTAPAAPAANTSKTDEVVTLTEFSVSAGKVGYIPTESTTGSRMAVMIKDLPYSISAITSEWVKDFGLIALTDELAFSSSMNGLNDVGGFSLRGVGGNICLRNRFPLLGFFYPVVDGR